MMQHYVTKWLAQAGICVNGNAPWDIKIHNPRIYQRFYLFGTLGAGESYMDGDWDCEALDQMTTKLYHAHYANKSYTNDLPALLLSFKSHIFNMGNRINAFKVGQQHYDVGNDLYEKMLDSRLIYSCGYWRNAMNLEQAQEAKLDLICRKLQLKPGMRLLDIGGGWGGLSRYAAEKYGVSVVNVSVSKEQVIFADAHKKELPIDNRLQDYRDITGIYDRIVSIGMFEHVGSKNYHAYLQFAAEHLTDDGLFLLHTIGASISRKSNDPWIERYIFPNSMLPSADQISHAAEKCFIMEDWHNFGADYDTTLMAWNQQFEAAWPELSSRYSERFHRMWHFYLMTSAASFRARYNQLWQIVFSKKGIPGGYESIR